MLYRETGERENGQNIIFNMYSKQKRNFNRIVTKISMFPQYLLLFIKSYFPARKPLSAGVPWQRKGSFPEAAAHNQNSPCNTLFCKTLARFLQAPFPELEM